MIVVYSRLATLYTIDTAAGLLGARALNAEETQLLARCESADVAEFTPFAEKASPVGELIGVRLSDGRRVLTQMSAAFDGEKINGAALVSWIRLESVAVEMGAGMVLEEISRQPWTGLETPASVPDEEAVHEHAKEG